MNPDPKVLSCKLGSGWKPKKISNWWRIQIHNSGFRQIIEDNKTFGVISTLPSPGNGECAWFDGIFCDLHALIWGIFIQGCQTPGLKKITQPTRVLGGYFVFFLFEILFIFISLEFNIELIFLKCHEMFKNKFNRRNEMICDEKFL